MIDINTLTEKGFQDLPLVVEGESKEVRYAGDGLVVIRFKPTIYSFTHNRCGVVEGSDVLRLKATKVFTQVLKDAGIDSAYLDINDKWVLADLVLPAPCWPKYECGETRWGDDQFVGHGCQGLKVAPPVEIVVKRMHSGTSKHRYFWFTGYEVRENHPLYAKQGFELDGPYPEAIVRFDWRNPLFDSKGKRLEDEILPTSIADWFIDTTEAERTALRVYDVLSDFLATKDIVCYDLCLFITTDGKTVFGEISQDCGRFRHFDLGSLDKDVWRAGGSSEHVLEKWQLLLDLIGG
jgi:phosphoribosylaminoimidazole-succinocarboxamide synthase